MSEGSEQGGADRAELTQLASFRATAGTQLALLLAQVRWKGTVAMSRCIRKGAHNSLYPLEPSLGLSWSCCLFKCVRIRAPERRAWGPKCVHKGTGKGIERRVTGTRERRARREKRAGEQGIGA